MSQIADRSEDSIIPARAIADLARFFSLGCLVDPLPELLEALKRTFNGKSERMRRITMSAQDTSS
ncbi:hypothetical protein MPLSOD_300006 [Mesorhizobium sp. SOD10]|nr:hypothetical protein MPLSOD_300006 [Mesorhizobium sp. SOD10]